MIVRGRLVTLTAAGVIEDGVVSFEDSRLGYVGPADEFPGSPPPPDASAIVLPGLVDVHCHGGGGYGFPDADLDGIIEAARFHRSHGTTTLVASLVSAGEAELGTRLDALAPAVDNGLLSGIHLEGPFISEHRCGAHDPTRIVPGDPAMLRRLIERAGGRIASVTLAPETARFDELTRILADAGILISLGHTEASYDRTTSALSETRTARTSITHLFNAMAPLAHRKAGFLTAALAAAGRGEVVVELIGDGVHLADGTVQMVFDTIGAEHIALITDAMAAAGRPDGRYRLGGLDVDVLDGVARLRSPTGDGAIAGGTATALAVLRRTVRDAGVDLVDAIRSATATPARLLGIHGDRGVLRTGMRADLIVTDSDLESPTVYKNGELWS